MKKLLALIFVVLLFFGCKEEDPPLPNNEYVEVGLTFNKWVKSNITVSGFTAAKEFTDNHILSNSTNATITLTPDDPTLSIITVIARINELVNLTFSLKTGATYTANIVYQRKFADNTHKAHDNGLAFDGYSNPILISESTIVFPIDSLSTDQSLVLIDKDSTDLTFETKFSDGSVRYDSIKADTVGIAWLMFDSPKFWYLYVDPVKETDKYYFQYKTIGGVLRNNLFPGIFEPEKVYLISEVEEGNVSLTFDYDDIFGDVTVVGN